MHAITAIDWQPIGAMLTVVLLTFVVGGLLLLTRVREMRHQRIHPQAASASVKMASRLEDVQRADNLRKLFEVPVLFYALGAVALVTQRIPDWLVAGAWCFAALRWVHSFIHCPCHKVMHRLAVFLAGFALLVSLWVAFVWSLPVVRAA